jgi:hypothetical protein
MPTLNVFPLASVVAVVSEAADEVLPELSEVDVTVAVVESVGASELPDDADPDPLPDAVDVPLPPQAESMLITSPAVTMVLKIFFLILSPSFL